MNGFTRVRRNSTLMLGLALLCVPTMLQAQTAEERAREQALRQRMEERLQAVQEERLVRIEEALARVGEARELAQQQVQKARQVVVRVRARVRLGVSLDGAQGAELNRQGARIQSIIEDTPAEEAGLREGDIITHLNGQSLLDPIPNEDDQGLNEGESLPVQRLMALAQDLNAGDDVEIRYLRAGEAQTVSFEAAEIDEPSFTFFRGDLGDVEGVFRFDPEMRGAWNFTIPDREHFEFELQELEKLDELKLKLRDLKLDEPNIRFRSLPEGMVRGFALGGGESPMVYSIMGRMAGFGLELTELNPGLAEYFSSDEGILVLDVDEDSTLGLLPGDVILTIDGRTVEDQGDVRRILGSYEDEETVSFTVVRKGRETSVEGTIR